MSFSWRETRQSCGSGFKIPGGSWAGEQVRSLGIVSEGHVQSLRPLVVLAVLHPLLADTGGLKCLLSKESHPVKEWTVQLYMGGGRKV